MTSSTTSERSSGTSLAPVTPGTFSNAENDRPSSSDRANWIAPEPSHFAKYVVLAVRSAATANSGFARGPVKFRLLDEQTNLFGALVAAAGPADQSDPPSAIPPSPTARFTKARLV